VDAIKAAVTDKETEMQFFRFNASSLILFTALVAYSPAFAQGRGGVDAGPIESRDFKVEATGLTPAFPAGLDCVPISSLYGSPTRHDGSPRVGVRNGGLHGGIDLTVEEGTPLRAIAAGEVIAKGEGGRLEGYFLWLRHAPEDSGQPFWTFAKFQHLSETSPLALGEKVRMGQVVASAGRSGTVGGYFGPKGYPHLHLSTFFGPSKEFALAGTYSSMVQGQDARIGDPLLLYKETPSDPRPENVVPVKSGTVSVAVVDAQGGVYPSDAKTVWPVACQKM